MRRFSNLHLCTFKDNYGKLPPICSRFEQRHKRFAVHLGHAKDELISNLSLWRAFYSRKLRYHDIFTNDTAV